MECKHYYSIVKLLQFLVLCQILLNVSWSAFSQDIIKNVEKLKDLFKYEEAINLLNQVDVSEIDSLTIKKELADCLYSCGRIEDALDYYVQLVELDPEDIRSQIRQMTILYQLKLYPVCIETGHEIIQKDSIKSVISLVGDAYSKMEALDSALVYYRLAMKRAPDDSKTLSKLCDVLLKQNRHADIINETSGFLSRHLNHPQIGPYQGLAYYLSGKYNQSIRVFDSLISSGVETPVVHYYKGLCHYRLSEYSEALQELLPVYQSDPTDISVTVYLADILTKSDADFNQEVIPLYEQVLEQMKPDPEVMYKIFSTYAEDCQLVGQYMEAINYYKEALKYKPEHINSLYAIAGCYEKINDLQSAQVYYSKYLAVSENEPAAIVEYVKYRIEYIKGELFMLE